MCRCGTLSDKTHKSPGKMDITLPIQKDVTEKMLTDFIKGLEQSGAIGVVGTVIVPHYKE